MHLPVLLAAADPESLNLWEMIQSVGWVLAPLVLLSILILALIIFNFYWLRDRRVASAEFLSEARLSLKDGNLEELIDLCHHYKGDCAKVLARVIEFARDNPETRLEHLREVAETAGARTVTAMNRPNLLLMDCGAMAPLVGLLGTVVGILRSFGHIAGNTTPMRTVLLAGGVSQALMATAIGLVIGLTAMLFYAYFRGRVQAFSAHFDATLTELLVKTNNCLARGRRS
ncbi:MAG: MotA/TolQ/ExbB proton channel family protein [Verrucomicrobiales bacterium]|jgi:biopolymer transport protein ExbB|nr:MotA/TolQ/ExbB proton channel family protein [Verrucomicrobiales bacterium]